MTDDQILDLLRERGPLRFGELRRVAVDKLLAKWQLRWWSRFISPLTLEYLVELKVPMHSIALERLRSQGRIIQYFGEGDYPRPSYYRIVDPDV